MPNAARANTQSYHRAAAFVLAEDDAATANAPAAICHILFSSRPRPRVTIGLNPFSYTPPISADAEIRAAICQQRRRANASWNTVISNGGDCRFTREPAPEIFNNTVADNAHGTLTL